MRSVDVGKSQVGVGVVHRGKLEQPANASVAEHDLISEVYHVIDGSATLVTGPDIADMKRRPADLQTVREFNGPGNGGANPRHGGSHPIKAVDGNVIFAGTRQWVVNNHAHNPSIDDRVRPAQ